MLTVDVAIGHDCSPQFGTREFDQDAIPLTNLGSPEIGSPEIGPAEVGSNQVGIP